MSSAKSTWTSVFLLLLTPFLSYYHENITLILDKPMLEFDADDAPK